MTAAKRKKERIQAPKGMKDVLPKELKYWDAVFRVMEDMLTRFGFEKIVVPVVEETDLYVRGVGEATDVVEKEMYNFKTPGKDNLSLRPEFTAGIARAYLQNGMESWPMPVKLYARGPLFRYERPQSGRYRMHHQLSCEVLGDADPAIDAQAIQLAIKILSKLGLDKLVIKINSIGCQECRKDYLKVLKNYYRGRAGRLCKVCKERYKKNVLRVLDCKEEKCKEIAASAPQVVDHLCEDCYKHFRQVLEILDELEYPYLLDPALVRGLDYYTRTVFEIYAEDDAALDLALCGGGRYDGLVEELGGNPTPGMGFGMGIERLILELKRIGYKPSEERKIRVFVVQLGEMGKKRAMKLFEELIDAGIKVGESLGRGSIKSQLKVADRKGADLALIIGQKEALDGTVIIRDMQSGVQETVDYLKVMAEVKKRLKKGGNKVKKLLKKRLGRRIFKKEKNK
jgi:histidyl-tRNA synthetase